MKKSLIVLLLSLVLITGLYGEFSVNESPSGHVYNPKYYQCEAYTSVPVPTHIIVDNTLSNPGINGTIIGSTGSINITVRDIAIFQYFIVKLNGAVVTDYQISGNDVLITKVIRAGKHTISVLYSIMDPQYSGYTQACSIGFEVIGSDHYYQNQYANIYPITNNLSEYSAARPTLFVEGFYAPGIISGGSEYTYGLIYKWRDFFHDRSVYMLSLNDSMQDVRDNSMIVLGALRFIHNIQTSALIEGTSVFGYSMGGILARYALAFAEHWGIPHYCTQYVSLDAPHCGGAINYDIQEELDTIESNLDLIGKEIEFLNDIIDALKSPVAKQLIRTNYFASGDTDGYYPGSNEYQQLFSEINEEENSLLNACYDVINSNSDPSFQGRVKPGFPYKQNSIKCLAYSNGSLNVNTDNSSGDPVATFQFRNDLFTQTYNITSRDYDIQPGSVLDDISRTEYNFPIVFEVTAHFAPVVVPTRSSLFLKPNHINGGSPIPDLAIDKFTSLESYQAELISHTYFDRLVFAPNTIPVVDTLQHGSFPHYDEFNRWNWRHGELSWKPHPCFEWVENNITASDSWLDLVDNRAVCTIRGQVFDNNISAVTGTMLINGVENREFPIGPNGFYEIPYLYTHDASVSLLFKKSGDLQLSRDVQMSYSTAMQNDYIVSNVYMPALDLTNIRVSSTGDELFISINAALDFIMDYVGSEFYTGEAIRIKVFPGTYAESVDLSPLAALGITNFTLEGVGEAIINGDGYGIKLVVDDNSPCNGAVYAINSLKIGDSGRGILFKDYWDELSGDLQSPQLTLNINNCTIYSCGSSSYTGTSNPIFSAAAIHFEGAGSITNCHLYDNVMTTGSDTYSQYCQAGGLFVNNNTSSETQITYNKFINNTGALGGGLVAKGKGNILIRNNEFSNNISSWYCDIYNAYEANALSVYDASNILIKDNLFIDNIPSNTPYGSVIGLRTYMTQAASPIKFLNNTIINSPQYSNSGFSAIKFRINAGVAVQDIQIKNNIISSTSNNGCTIDSGAGYSPLSINNNMLHNTSLSGFTANLYNPDDPNSVYNPSAPRFNYNCDPQLDANYVPIWNATTMSHCIDTGSGVNDSDGTPPDIGAFRSADHRYWQYRFRSGENDRSDTYHWVSYPVVNSLTQGKTVARSFFHELLGTHHISPEHEAADVLQEIVWYESNQSRFIVWNGVNWGPFVDTHSVVSPQGYKVKLLSVDNSGLPPTTVELHHSGFLTPDNTPFMIFGSSSNGGQTYENWIGYFDTESVWPTNAFASIWNDITMIKAKDWCLYRDPNSGIGALIGKMLPINCGDMVIVTTVNDHEFQWNTTTPTDPKKKEVPTAFEYVEKADYTPVYVDLSAIDLSNLKEIGLKLDGICKGAVVVTDSLEQICAYLDEGESLSSGLVELVFFYESKSQPMEMRSVAINNQQLSSSIIGGDSAYPVYNIKVSSADLSNTVVPVLSLEQNYPNPFNPTTSIRYSIEEPGSVSLDIYNIKGQLVKTLYKGNAEVGSHTAIWNGLDIAGNACSSGVYFYRLRTPDKTLVRKMLMLK